MLHFTKDDQQMMNHTVDIICDRMRHEDGYTPQDDATVVKLDQLAKAGPCLVVDRSEQGEQETLELAKSIVAAEIRNWVPNASQRLIRRAMHALDLPAPSQQTAKDHGPDRNRHALFPDWVGGLYVLHCATCHRLFRD